MQQEEASQSSWRIAVENGIEHIVTSVRRPSAIGEIEAFHRAYTIEASIHPTHKE
jgi:transposase InsO family protein